MAHRLYRTDLGPLFSEGARLLWVAVEAGGGIAAIRGRLNFSSGEMTRLLYGDRRANLAQANVCAERLAIPTTAWEQQPSQPYEPPAARAARARYQHPAEQPAVTA